MSLSLSLRRHGDTEDTSEHISARLCPCLSLIGSARTHRTRVSTSVLTRVLYVLIPVPSTPWGHPGHERAHRCSLVSCMSLSLYLWIPRTQVNTLVLTGVLYVPIPVSFKQLHVYCYRHLDICIYLTVNQMNTYYFNSKTFVNYEPKVLKTFTELEQQMVYIPTNIFISSG